MSTLSDKIAPTFNKAIKRLTLENTTERLAQIAVDATGYSNPKVIIDQSTTYTGAGDQPVDDITGVVIFEGTTSSNIGVMIDTVVVIVNSKAHWKGEGTRIG